MMPRVAAADTLIPSPPSPDWPVGTTTINVAVGVLIVPYRPALPTAKQVATVQELSGGRLILGLAVGWMDAEFKALGVNRHERGKITDETLEFFRECFEQDVVSRYGQAFIFSPRPAAPPIYIGRYCSTCIEARFAFWPRVASHGARCRKAERRPCTI